jgi:hypothetical protein
MDRAITTYPSTMGYRHICRFPCTQAPRRVQRNYLYPPGPDPTDRQVKDINKPEGTMNRHPNVTLLLLIQIILTLKNDEHVKIIAYKL